MAAGLSVCLRPLRAEVLGRCVHAVSGPSQDRGQAPAQGPALHRARVHHPRCRQDGRGSPVRAQGRLAAAGGLGPVRGLPAVDRARVEGKVRNNTRSGTPMSAARYLWRRCDRAHRMARSAWTATWGRPRTATARCTRCPTRSGWTRRLPASIGNRAASKAGARRTDGPSPTAGGAVNGQLHKLHRKREDSTHQASRRLADAAHIVVVEDLNTKGVTTSAKGTVAVPGRNVKQKAGLNRGLPASGWGHRERKPAYKAGQVVKVGPAHTSQTSSVCGHAHTSNRPSQAVFACGACGFRSHAGHNAARNIPARAGLPCVPVSARGTGAAARRGAIPRGTPTTRERDGPTA